MNKLICFFLLIYVATASVGCVPTNPDGLLTAEEQRWLVEHEGMIRYAPNSDYAPVDFIEDGISYGITADYIQLFEDRLDFHFEPVYFDNWHDILTALQQGDVDMVGAIQQTPDRSEYLVFTEPYITIPNAIVTRQGVTENLTPEAMQGMKVAIVEDYASYDIMRSRYPDLLLEPVDDTPTGLQMVSFGRADAMITDLAVASYYIDMLGINNLHVAGYIDYTWELSFAVREDLAELQPILQKVLDDIPPAEKRAIAQKWIHIERNYSTFSTRVLIILLASIAGGLLIIFGVVAWNASLRRQVRFQTEALARELDERVRTENTERKLRAFATSLAKNAEVINATLDLDTVIRRILYGVASVVTHDGANLMLVTDDRSGIRIEQICDCYATNALKKPEVGVVWPLEGLANLRLMLETGEPLIIEDVNNYDGWLRMETGIRSYIGMPIIIDEQVIGFLNVDSLTPNFFTPQHAGHLKAFANQAAIAIRNAQMYQKLASYNEDLEQAVTNRTAELTAANAELEKLSRVKDEFVSNVSHELRTPISGMRLHQYLLRKRPDRMDQYLGVIERETYRLEHTIEDLLRLSRLDQGRIDVTMTSVDLDQLADQFVADRALPAKELGITLLCAPVETRAIAWGDQGLLGQVLSILLTNALNYTPAGGEVTVSTHTREKDGQPWVGFSVSDTGPGIEASEQDQLFERFYRGAVGQESQSQGTGLGLAIARSIVDLHKGQIIVESTGVSGEGATFAVWLPVGLTPVG